MLHRFCLLFLCALPGLGLASDATAQAPSAEPVALRAVLQETLQNNPAVATAKNDAAIAERNASVGNAGFLPGLSVQARYNETISDTEQQFQGQDPQDISGARTTSSGADAELSWRVFDGLGGRLATLRRLQAERSAERQRTRATTDQLLTDAALAYYAVVRAQQQRNVLEETVSVSEERVRIVELRNEVGSASDLDVRRARVDLNADRSALLRQEAALESAKADLNRVRGRRTTATDFEVTRGIDVDEELSIEGIQASLRRANPVLQQASATLQAAEHERRALQAQRFPALDATLGYGVSRTESESGFVQESTTYDLTYGLSLQLPVFTGFDRRRQRQNAQVRIRNAELAVQDTENELFAALTQAFAEYQRRLDVVALETENLELARANVDVALRQFEVGDISSIELREVQEQAVRAESDLVSARFQAKQGELTLREIGGTTQDALPIP